ncbi:hypothetical protein NQ318_007127 [Aromia moschata]|uniref:Endonuclease/exonuclease/phosphatase domain-containing protein n=1 Tax=Aromia moschata TaxID=1265417 RepID=A0AAV8XEA0_9CUCU|nr:hypothetical protein NQ318_007127 [Aromia moschata]
MPLEFIQANIQHGKAQSAFLCKRIIESQIKIALIQEPWVYHGAKGVFPMPGLCTRDLAVIKLAIGKGNTKREVAICSAYFPRNTESPPRELSDLIRYCEGIGLPLLVGCDSNSHHTMWGDKEVKPRGRMLLEFLTLSGMQIANRGSVPTYFTPERQSVIDLTLCSTELLSQDLKGRLIGIPSRYESEADFEVVLNRLNSAIVESFEANCPLKQRTSSSKTPWWNSHVESHRRKVRKLFNKAKRTKNPNHWEDYKSAQREYKKVIRDSIRDTWRASCEDIIQLPSAARLSKVLTKDPGAKFGAVSLPDGGFTSSAGKTLQHLISVHFPGSAGTVATEDDNSKLNWNEHIANRTTKATSAIWACRRAFGCTWGLRPRILHWMYTAIVRPVITYGAIVWWPGTRTDKARKQLDKVQRLACLGITSAMRTAPSRAIEVLTGLPPLHLVIEHEAMRSAYRLTGQYSLCYRTVWSLPFVPVQN